MGEDKAKTPRGDLGDICSKGTSIGELFRDRALLSRSNQGIPSDRYEERFLHINLQRGGCREWPFVCGVDSLLGQKRRTARSR